jgi:hypothetical protein
MSTPLTILPLVIGVAVLVVPPVVCIGVCIGIGIGIEIGIGKWKSGFWKFNRMTMLARSFYKQSGHGPRNGNGNANANSNKSRISTCE